MLVDRRPCRLSKSCLQLLYFVPAALFLSYDSVRFLPPAWHAAPAADCASVRGRLDRGNDAEEQLFFARSGKTQTHGPITVMMVSGGTIRMNVQRVIETQWDTLSDSTRGSAELPITADLPCRVDGSLSRCEAILRSPALWS